MTVVLAGFVAAAFGLGLFILAAMAALNLPIHSRGHEMTAIAGLVIGVTGLALALFSVLFGV